MKCKDTVYRIVTLADVCKEAKEKEGAEQQIDEAIELQEDDENEDAKMNVRLNIILLMLLWLSKIDDICFCSRVYSQQNLL